ncbi:hypothetical protein GCM10027614_79600 [Micromonospora vulcania]
MPVGLVPGYLADAGRIIETVQVVTAIGQWVRAPEGVRRLAYVATGLIVTAVVATVDENVLVPSGWVWLVLPAALTAMALPRGPRTVVFAACAWFVAIVSTGESVQLAWRRPASYSSRPARILPADRGWDGRPVWSVPSVPSPSRC